ncbi:MAG: hypothetical protein JO352_04175 [Chloroflexi bacterium]|nr:hypothetical protein [Chloroflexota bacterium]
MSDEPLLPSSPLPPDAAPIAPIGSHDGQGAGDHDQPFFGFRAYHFRTHELARLLLLRSEALEARLGQGRWVKDLASES